jgi:hypothetical protein
MDENEKWKKNQIMDENVFQMDEKIELKKSQ